VRILIVTGIFPPDAGGPATYVPAAAAAFAARGHTVTVVTTSEASGAVASDGRSYRVVRISRRRPYPLRALESMAAIVVEGRAADVVYCNGLYPETVAANLILRRPLVMKIVGDWVWERATNRGWTTDSFDAFQRRQHGGRLAALCRVRNACVRRAEAIIVPSRFLAGAVERWGVPPSRLRVVPNASAAEARPEGEVRVPLRTTFRLITVARLVSWKRIDRLIRLLADWPEAGLIVVGDGPERARLLELAATLGLDARVWFAARVDRSAVMSLLAASDVFVLNSTYEGLPHVVIEAMRAGVPVVATDAGGTREVVVDGETGLLVPPDDPNALRDAVAALLTDPARRRSLAARAAAAVAARFTPAAMIDATEAVLADAKRPAVCLIGGARYSRPLDSTSARKFAALSDVARLYVVAFSAGARPRRFADRAQFYLLPSLPGAIIRYLLLGTVGTLLVLWCVWRYRAAVIVAQSPYEGVSGAAARSMARLLGRRAALVVESHGDFEAALFLQRRILWPAAYRAIMRRAARFAFKRCDALRAVSAATRAQLEAHAPGRPCVQFPAWTDLDVFREAGEARCAQDFSGKILYAGSLTPGKGVHVLVEAFEALASHHAGLHLTIVGAAVNRDYAARLRARVRDSRLSDRVTFLGAVSQDELARRMACADVLVLPTLTEGLGRVVLEGMACGTIVIGSNVGGVPDLIRDQETGLLVSPGDANDLADRIDWVLRHQETARAIATAGRAFALQFFSTGKYVDAFTKLLEAAVGSLRRAPR
jgi:glycosyltransferase involved in cell wall biosynthesis